MRVRASFNWTQQKHWIAYRKKSCLVNLSNTIKFAFVIQPYRNKMCCVIPMQNLATPKQTKAQCQCTPWHGRSWWRQNSRNKFPLLMRLFLLRTGISVWPKCCECALCMMRLRNYRSWYWRRHCNAFLARCCAIPNCWIIDKDLEAISICACMHFYVYCALWAKHKGQSISNVTRLQRALAAMWWGPCACVLHT